MKLIDLVNFFKSPADRDVIARRTAPPGKSGYRVHLPQPPDPERFAFLALGDTGDSAALRSRQTPQDAVAQYLAGDAALPETGGDAAFVLHTGDVVYMTGERRLYDRNFRRPYAAFLTPESTVDQLVFRLPFLPVPGNHDYYDFSGWAGVLSRAPVVGAGVAAIARELFSFHVPQGGSDMGAAYMQAFVTHDGQDEGLVYTPGRCTRIPNRYYRFRVGNVDFFALDSNTLESPPPDPDLVAAERKQAAQHIKSLQRRARTLNREIERDEAAVDRWLAHERRQVALDPVRLARLGEVALAVQAAWEGLAEALRALENSVSTCADVRADAEELCRKWTENRGRIAPDRDPDEATRALEALDRAGDDGCELLERLELCFVELHESPERTALEAAEAEVRQTATLWRQASTGRPPEDLCSRLQQLSATALEVQRKLALEKRRANRQPEDYDADQLEWLRTSLAESVRDNPDGWRVVFLHQPLYTTIGDHSENHDVVGVRENLVPMLREHVHLVLAGHAHAFEWFRTTALPNTGLVVTGGGGQPWLWRSILDPRQSRRYRMLYASLRNGGATETALAGNGPTAADGADGPLYHYVRIEVTPETLLVRPIGVRRVRGGYRREDPMPVYHVPEFPEELPSGRPPWETRFLHGIEIRRNRPPRPLWG